MFSSIRIERYRGFASLEMSGLGRVNLLVGSNNSGKTSLLEAIYLLNSMGDPLSLWQLLSRRGEWLPAAISPGSAGSDRLQGRMPLEVDVSRLFRGHDLQAGCSFSISTANDTERRLECSVEEVSRREQPELFASDEESGLASRLVLRSSGKPRLDSAVVLTGAGGLSREVLGGSALRAIRQRQAEGSPAQFITTESFSASELGAMWNNIALTPTEALVLSALQFLDPNIERIAVLGTGSYQTPNRGGFIIKLKGLERPIPIGSMGDGMWRMLAMAMAITQCKGGVLLVDEIDTGLHYSVMAKMWGLIFNTAKALDVQVFATTHSHDCVYSLAQLCSEVQPGESVTVQRIESGSGRAVPYDPLELAAAASRGIEIR